MAALVSAGRHGIRRHRALRPSHPARRDLRRPVARRTRADAPRGSEDPARARGVRRPGRGASSCTPTRPPTPRRWPPAGRRPSRAGPGRRRRRGGAACPRPRRATRRRRPPRRPPRARPGARARRRPGRDRPADRDHRARRRCGSDRGGGDRARRHALLRRPPRRRSDDPAPRPGAAPGGLAGTRTARGRAPGPELHLGVGTARGHGDDRRAAGPGRPGRATRCRPRRWPRSRWKR